MDALEGPNLVLNPHPDLYLFLIVTELTQGNINTIHPIGVVPVELKVLFVV